MIGKWPLVFIGSSCVAVSTLVVYVFKVQPVQKAGHISPHEGEQIRRTRSQAIGCLYGQLIGDSLGARYEYRPARIVQERIKKDRNSTTGFLPILGGGPYGIKPGQVTDDSEMALSLASSLTRCGKFNAIDVACSYVCWAQSGPITVEMTTRNALNVEGKRLTSNWHKDLNDLVKKRIHQEVLENVRKRNSGSLSNGCLMRISPLAIYSVNVPREKVKELVYAESSLTHFEIDVKEGVYAYVMAIRDLLKGRSNKAAYQTALNVTHSKRIREHLLVAEKKPIPIYTGTQYVNGDEESAAYFGVALQSAFYELLHGTSFEKSLIEAISRGGDTDTNGAIVAAMLGARFGVDGIPAEWIKTIKESKPRPTFTIVDYDVERIVSKLLAMKY